RPARRPGDYRFFVRTYAPLSRSARKILIAYTEDSIYTTKRQISPINRQSCCKVFAFPTPALSPFEARQSESPSFAFPKRWTDFRWESGFLRRRRAASPLSRRFPPIHLKTVEHSPYLPLAYRCKAKDGYPIGNLTLWLKNYKLEVDEVPK